VKSKFPQNIWINRSTDEEKRKLRIDLDRLQRALVTRKKKQEELNEEAGNLRQVNKDQQKFIEKQNQEIENLKQEIEKLKRQRDTYRSMLFKENKPKVSVSSSPSFLPKRSIGGQIGHKGYGRKLPARIDRQFRIYANNCPTCKGKLTRSYTTAAHTVEDIPEPKTLKTIVTRYEVERQWCRKCKKEVTVTPVGVIPYSKLGIHLIIQILIWKYICRMPMEIIVSLLQTTCDLSISAGTVALCLRRARRFFDKPYKEILAAIRAAPVKHADETSWRINGQNTWVWEFLTKQEVYYTIEETRGGGVPKAVLENANSDDVLIHDDYVVYKNLSFQHQSCWAHMLRKSHEEVSQENVSLEMKLLHQQLKAIYETLVKETAAPFDLSYRQQVYNQLLLQINQITHTSYHADDARRIQTRVRTQNKNLLTAILYPNVPLTNNLAERMIRPLVVQRKISGGSRSRDGATIHAVNMSVIQTMKLRGRPLVSTLRGMIFDEANGVL